MPIKRILVVDDSPTERFQFTEVLTANGYEVMTAGTGEEAIAMAKSHQPDLVLMDVIMPGINGFQATRNMARDEQTRHIPVIICTTKALETDRLWGLRQGARDYLVKPVQRSDLLGKIRALG